MAANGRIVNAAESSQTESKSKNPAEYFHGKRISSLLGRLFPPENQSRPAVLASIFVLISPSDSPPITNSLPRAETIVTAASAAQFIFSCVLLKSLGLNESKCFVEILWLFGLKVPWIEVSPWRLNEVIQLAADGIQQVLGGRLSAVAALVHTSTRNGMRVGCNAGT